MDSPAALGPNALLRKEISLPLILVGGMRYRKDMEAVLNGGTAEAISMCRPFIRDPLIVHKLKSDLTDYSDCNSCNGCVGLLREGDLSCILQ